MSSLLLEHFQNAIKSQQISIMEAALAKFRADPAQKIEFFVAFFAGYSELESLIESFRNDVKVMNKNEKELLDNASTTPISIA